MKSRSLNRLYYIMVITVALIYLLARVFYIGNQWLTLVSMSLLLVPLLGLIGHKRWCAKEQEPFETATFIIATFIWLFVTVVAVTFYFRFCR